MVPSKTDKKDQTDQPVTPPKRVRKKKKPKPKDESISPEQQQTGSWPFFGLYPN